MEVHGFGDGRLVTSLNQINDFDTNLYASFVIHGFDVSLNNQCINEEVCRKNMQSLVGQPVLVKYFNDGDKSLDHLGSHEVTIGKNRDTNEDIMVTNTTAIGTFQRVGIEDVKIDGKLKRCLVGYAQLWFDRYYNICSLLNEWLEMGVPVYCSCEYIFKNFEMKNGVQYIKTPYKYTGHVILNSEEKDGYGVVLPAYDEARMLSWNSALKKDALFNKSNSDKRESDEMENVFLKSLNDLSFGDVCTKLYGELEKKMPVAEYKYLYISEYDIYPDYFLYEIFDEETESWVLYKINYISDNEDVEIDYENRVKLEHKLVEVDNDMSEQLIELKENDISQKETIISLTSTIEQLSNTISELEQYKEKYEAEQYNSELNSVKEEYRSKFEKLNALDKFEDENVQSLIVDTLDKEKSLDAKSALLDIMFNLVCSTNSVLEKSKNSAQGTKGFVEHGSGLGTLRKEQHKVVKDTDVYDGKVNIGLQSKF